MNLLHGDHAALQTESLRLRVATVGSHEIGNPRTTLARGWAYSLYSLCTIDVRGDKKSAE